MADPFVLGMCYPSEEAGTHVEANSTKIKFPLLLREDAEFEIPYTEYKYSYIRSAANAGPNSMVKKRALKCQGQFSWKGLVCDLTPFVLVLNGAATTTTEQFKCTQNASALPKKILVHTEQNEYYVPRVMDYTDAYCEEAKFYPDNKLLGCTLSGRAGTETAGHQLSTSPTAQRGDASLQEGYPLNDLNNTVTWNSKTLSAYIRELTFSIKAKISFHEVQGSTTLKFQNEREMEYSEIAMRFVVLGAAADAALDEIEALIDASTSSNLVVKLCRSSADYLKITFGSVMAKKWHAVPFNSKRLEGTYIDALFSIPVLSTIDSVSTPIEVREKQASANASASYDI